MFNFVESLFSTMFSDPPVKEHASIKRQFEIARAFNSPKEIAQAAQIDDQDRGGIPNPEDYIRDMKQEAATMATQKAVVVLEVGQRFKAPEGYQIKEVRSTGEVLFYGSILKGRKLNNELKGAKFSLVRR